MRQGACGHVGASPYTANPWKSELGSTTLEFAVVMPVVVLLVFGSMVAMLGLMAYGNATYATAIGARYASLHSGTSASPATAGTVQSQVQSRLWLSSPQANVTSAWSAGNVVGSSVTVKTTLTVPLAIPLAGINQLTISTSAVRVITH